MPSAVYAAGVTGGAIVLSGASPSASSSLLPIALVTSIAWMAHVLDRAKVLRRWRDPADRMADPDREAGVDRHRVKLLVLAAVLCVVAFLLALAINAWLELLLPAGITAVIVYGSRPSDSRRTRPKDVLLAKNLLTGLAYATLVGAVLWAALPDSDGFWVALGVVALLVSADAMLSDIDDRPSDARFGTTTVAVIAGRRWATLVSAMLYAGGIALWLLLGEWGAGSALFVLGMAFSGLATSPLRRLRTPIDLRGGLIGLAALLVG